MKKGVKITLELISNSRNIGSVEITILQQQAVSIDGRRSQQRILSGGERHHFGDADVAHPLAQARPMDPVAVAEQAARRGVLREDINDLLCGPLGSRSRASGRPVDNRATQ